MSSTVTVTVTVTATAHGTRFTAHALSAAESYAFQPAVAEGDPSLVCYATWFESSETYGIAATRIGTGAGADE